LRQPTTNNLQTKQKIANFHNNSRKSGQIAQKITKTAARRKSREKEKTIFGTRSLEHAGVREKRLLAIPIAVRHGRRIPNF